MIIVLHAPAQLSVVEIHMAMYLVCYNNVQLTGYE